MTSGFLFFFLGLIPLAFIFAFSILELVIAFVQAQVFIILTCSYIKDALFLHSDTSPKPGLVEKPLNLTQIKNQQSVVSGRRYYSTRSSRSVKFSNFNNSLALIVKNDFSKIRLSVLAKKLIIHVLIILL